jgi:hypothetical protein
LVHVNTMLSERFDDLLHPVFGQAQIVVVIAGVTSAALKVNMGWPSTSSAITSLSSTA